MNETDRRVKPAPLAFRRSCAWELRSALRNPIPMDDMWIKLSIPLWCLFR